MKKYLILLLCALMLCLGAGQAWAVDTTWFPGTIAIGLDARSFGMGGACLAVFDRWAYPTNPAGLVCLTEDGLFMGRFVNPEIESEPLLPEYARGFQQWHYVTYVHPDDGSGAYSLSVNSNEYIYLDDIAAGAYRFNTYISLQYGYGFRVNNNMSVGFNLRRTQAQFEFTDDLTYFRTVLTLDVGAVFQPSRALTLSVLVTDVLAPLVAWTSEGDDYFYTVVYPQILIGGSFRLGNLLVLALDVDANIAGENDLLAGTRAGFELRPLPLLAVRGGYYHGQPTVGLGFRMGNPDKVEVNLDFAQYWPESGEGYLDPVQCMQVSVYF